MPLNYASSRETALQQYQAAAHLLTVTFPLVKDPKLLVGVLHNLFRSLEAAMDSVLAYDQQLYFITQELSTFESRYAAFKLKSVRRHAIPPEMVFLISDLKETLDLHKKSPMEFQRGNRVVICTKDYQMKVISLTEIKQALDQAKQFLKILEQLQPDNRK